MSLVISTTEHTFTQYPDANGTCSWDQENRETAIEYRTTLHDTPSQVPHDQDANVNLVETRAVRS